MVNLDTGTAFAFVSEGSPIRHHLKAFVAGRQMVMCQTAYNEFMNVIFTIAGPAEWARAYRLLARINLIPDNPSDRVANLKTSNNIGEDDKLIFGTGDRLGIPTMSADRKFVRAAKANGVDLDVYMHQSQFLMGV